MPDESAVAAERAYVPPAQRQPIDVIDDSIVVVGQARQKKRKRVKLSAQDADPQGTATSEAVSSAEWIERNGSSKRLKRRQHSDANDSLEPFDYSKVPNILDDVPIPEQDHGRKRKKKQKQGTPFTFMFTLYRSSLLTFTKTGGMVYGDFPAPPKAHRETKSGNQSYTFK